MIVFRRPADPRIQRTHTGAWLVKGGGPTRRYSTKIQAVRAMVRRPRHGAGDLQVELGDPSWHTLGAAASRPYIGVGVDYRALLPRPDPSAVEAELCKIPGVVSATVRFNLPESVEILGTVTISVADPLKLPIADPVHWCDWADQPEVRIFCTQQGSTPDSTGEFRTVRGDRYTFYREEATCPRCRP